MKTAGSICLLLALFALHADGQNSSNVFRIDEIPTNLLLNEGWEFKAGDNPEWSKEVLNDGDWSPIDPTLELHNLRQVVQFKGGINR